MGDTPWHVRSTFFQVCNRISRQKHYTTQHCSYITILNVNRHRAAKSLPLPLFTRLFIFFLRFYYVCRIIYCLIFQCMQHTLFYTCQNVAKNNTTETTMKFIALGSCAHARAHLQLHRLLASTQRNFPVDRFDVAHNQTRTCPRKTIAKQYFFAIFFLLATNINKEQLMMIPQNVCGIRITVKIDKKARINVQNFTCKFRNIQRGKNYENAAIWSTSTCLKNG